MNSVAAKGDGASGCTGIFGVGVAVIAGFFTVPKNAVAADSGGAGVEAGIGVDGVAIIALLTLLHRAITAARRLAGVAVIGRVFVAVIAALARTYNSIAAARQLAIG